MPSYQYVDSHYKHDMVRTSHLCNRNSLYCWDHIFVLNQPQISCSAEFNLGNTKYWHFLSFLNNDYGATGWNPSLQKTRANLFCLANTSVADDLAIATTTQWWTRKFLSTRPEILATFLYIAYVYNEIFTRPNGIFTHGHWFFFYLCESKFFFSLILIMEILYMEWLPLYLYHVWLVTRTFSFTVSSWGVTSCEVTSWLEFPAVR